MSGLGLQDDSQSADGQLQLGLQLIQQSYNRRVEELTREVEHWKRVAQHHKQQEAQTREELGKSNQRGSELQRQLGEKNQEVAQLTEARNVALNQIATLKKHASQLQSFKKNISNMLQVPVPLLEMSCRRVRTSSSFLCCGSLHNPRRRYGVA